MKKHMIFSKNEVPLFLRLVNPDSQEAFLMEEMGEDKNFLKSLALELESIFNTRQTLLPIGRKFGLSTSILCYGLDPLSSCLILNQNHLDRFFLELQIAAKNFDPRILSIEFVQVIEGKPYIQEMKILLEVVVQRFEKEQKISCEITFNTQVISFNFTEVYASAN
jgi:predicted component of type VI protein secretion system